MSMPHDYYGSNSGGAPCQYASLGTYTSNYEGGTESQAKITMGKAIVPQWGAMSSYDSMAASTPNCIGYDNIETAYGRAGGNCQTTYRSTLCGGRKAN